MSTIKASSPTVVEPVGEPEVAAQSHVQATVPIQSHSLVVSVPLVNTCLTDHHNIVGGGQLAALPNALMPERSSSVGSVTERMSVINSGTFFFEIFLCELNRFKFKKWKYILVITAM